MSDAARYASHAKHCELSITISTSDAQDWRAISVFVWVRGDLEVMEGGISSLSHGLELLLPALRLGCSLLCMAQLRLYTALLRQHVLSMYAARQHASALSAFCKPH